MIEKEVFVTDDDISLIFSEEISINSLKGEIISDKENKLISGLNFNRSSTEREVLTNSKEILVAEYWGQISTIDNNGNQLPGWQYDMGNQIWGTPAIGDLDGDGENEIVLTSKNGKAVILDINGNELLEYDTGQFLMGTPALGNLDMDEDLEIVFGGYTPSGKIFAINSDGSDVSGFPIILSERILGGVALADLNSNLKDDIVFATQE